MALSNNPTNNQLVKEVKRLEEAKQDTLPNASAAGKVLKSTDTQGGTEWADIPDASNKMDKVNPSGTGSFSLNRASGSTEGVNSVSLGTDNTASGRYSTALGYQNTASGDFSHAQGEFTTASGWSSTAEGVYTTASGRDSHAENSNTTASGAQSHSSGFSTEASRKSQFVFGEYNVVDTQGTDGYSKGAYIEIVGNGTSDGSRSNARTLDWNGNEELSGNLKAAGLTDGTTTKTMTEILAGGGGASTNVKVDGTSITSNNEADLQTINGDYNASTNPLATQNDLPTVPNNIETTTNKVTSISSSSTDTQYPSAKAVYDAIQDVSEIAEGKTANYVISDATTGTNVVNSSFNSTQDTVAITITDNKITDVQGNDINLSDLKIGDIVSVTETSVPDRWVGSIANSTITFYKLETKLDIDANPTSGSSNPVSSGGVYSALANKMDRANPTGTGSLSINRKSNSTVGEESTAIGAGCEASGRMSVAMGAATKATAYCAVAEGNVTSATGNNAHSMGSYTTAQRKSQLVFGEYNVADTAGADGTKKGSYVEIVGNGTAYNAKSNARTLDWSGNEVLAGTSTATKFIGGLEYLTTAPTAANTNGIKIVVLSSEPATRYSGYIYFITE